MGLLVLALAGLAGSARGAGVVHQAPLAAAPTAPPQANCAMPSPSPSLSPTWFEVDSVFAYCANAKCEMLPSPAFGQPATAACTCFLNNGESVGPSLWQGANTYQNVTCTAESMQGGTYWSTAAADPSSATLGTSVTQFASCPSSTPWAYCWGAPCEQPSAGATTTLCYCPVLSGVTGSSSVNQTVILPGGSCTDDPCSRVWNSCPDSYFKDDSDFCNT
jgi:hypothetical protein